VVAFVNIRSFGIGLVTVAHWAKNVDQQLKGPGDLFPGSRPPVKRGLDGEN